MPHMPHAPGIRRNHLEKVRAADLMTPNPVSVRREMSVREAALFLHGRGIGAAPVVNDAGRAVGVLSRSDVLLAVSAGVDTAPVREVMTPSVIAVPPDATALDVTDAMVRHMVRRVFVTDDEGVPVGVVSTTDLFRVFRVVWGGPILPDDTSGPHPHPHRRSVYPGPGRPAPRPVASPGS